VDDDLPVPSGVLPYVRFLLSSLASCSSCLFSSNTRSFASSELCRCSGFAEGRSRSWLPSALAPWWLTSAMACQDTVVRNLTSCNGRGVCCQIFDSCSLYVCAGTLCMQALCPMQFTAGVVWRLLRASNARQTRVRLAQGVEREVRVIEATNMSGEC
jgi:hypothetical protein